MDGPPDWLVREHQVLRRAMNRLRRKRPFCEDCGSRDGWLVFSPVECSYRVRVRHARSCPVLRSPHSRNACNSYISGWLIAYGRFMADYGDQTVGEHEAAAR